MINDSQHFIECRADVEVFDFSEVAACMSYHSQCKHIIIISSYNTISNSTAFQIESNNKFFIVTIQTHQSHEIKRIPLPEKKQLDIGSEIHC